MDRFHICVATRGRDHDTQLLVGLPEIGGADQQKAEAKPNSFLARLWRWHTTRCPGWKAYQQSLNASS
jgi:hypothetical protein